jgi:uncharacterized damage-inducible protein DinB
MHVADLRFPIGEFVTPEALTSVQRHQAIDGIATATSQLQDAVAGLSAGQLDVPYRPGGWSVRQVVHHLPDSHMNSYVRLKLALTEEEPTIRTYDEARWAELPDSAAPVELSIDLLGALHRRWVLLLRSLKDAQWSRRFRHPDLGVMRVDELVAYYDWHGRHHVAHITSLRQKRGW